jgi:hypothetical protein
LVEDARVGARLLRELPSFLRHPITVEAAGAALRQRFEHRGATFLSLVKRAICGNPTSPYHPLLNHAGCEYEDIERLVRQDGVEGALRVLYRHGVYLTVEEFKGRRPVVRGNVTIDVRPDQFRNPGSAGHVPVRSSGSGGPATSVLINLAYLRDRAVNTCLTLDARGGNEWAHASWGVPGAGGMIGLLVYSGFGGRTVQWFSQIRWTARTLSRRYRWSVRLLRWASLAAMIPLLSPRYVPLEDPRLIVDWMADVLRSGGTPHVRTSSSGAVRLCQAATAAGISLLGAQFTVDGEPMTDARRTVIGRAGATAIPGYGAIEAGSIGDGCLAPEVADDMHLFHDRHAVIRLETEREREMPSGALLFSSLRSTAPLVLLNVSLGDQAVLSRRACGCPLERLGWTTHLQQIRSFEKLTAAGMTFLDTNVLRVLEEVLPARFGGGPTHYQLLEEEAEDGQPCLRLLVHPAIGALDLDAVAETFFTAISAGSGGEKVMGLVWRNAKLLRVERRVPLVTGSGKILHLIRSRSAPPRNTHDGDSAAWGKALG